MRSPKFKRGELVRVDIVMPKFMEHFPGGFEAIVVQCSSTSGYQLYNHFHGLIAWYSESQLTKIGERTMERLDELDKYLGNM